LTVRVPPAVERKSLTASRAALSTLSNGATIDAVSTGSVQAGEGDDSRPTAQMTAISDAKAYRQRPRRSGEQL
jgi:hypothetical protein